MSTLAARRAPSPVAHVGPNWFAAVMGTGIVATATATLPVRLPGLEVLAIGAWIIAVAVLVAVVAATVVHWVSHPLAARGHLDHPVMSHFYGAPAMALMTVGAGTLLVGHQVIGMRAAIVVDLVLWTTGTVAGLATTWIVPRRTRRRPDPYAGPAFGGWLMPVVPPMVSAATGALLVPHLPVAARPGVLVLCAGLFGVAVVTATPLLVLVVGRAVRGDVPAAAGIPTLFIVLGPLGQSVTAAHALGDRAGGAWTTAALAFGLPVAALAIGWLVVATTLVTRSARTGLPFGLTWWSFTFPVGTVVTGVSGLAAQTGWSALSVLAVAVFGVLLGAWATVATLTVRGIRSGELLRAPQTP